MLNKPPPFKVLNTKIPIIFPIKRRGFINQGSGLTILKLQLCFGWTPHKVMVTMRDNGDYIRVLLYSYYAASTGGGGSTHIRYICTDVAALGSWCHGSVS